MYFCDDVLYNLGRDARKPGFGPSEQAKLILFCSSAEISLTIERGSHKVWKITMGVCPHLEFDNITLINCLGYDFYMYGAFEFLCKIHL